VHKEEIMVLSSLAIMTVLVCLLFPVLSAFMVVPYLTAIYSTVSALAISSGNMYIMAAMLALIILLVIVGYGKTSKRIVPIYMAGVNAGDDLSFNGSIGRTVPVSLKNWYMEDYFGEKKMNVIGNISTVVIMTLIFSLLLGGVL